MTIGVVVELLLCLRFFDLFGLVIDGVEDMLEEEEEEIFLFEDIALLLLLLLLLFCVDVLVI